MDDFRKIPFTTPDDLRDKGHDFLCVDSKLVKQVFTVSSSELSDKDKCIFFTEEDLEETIDFFQNGISYLMDQSDKVLILLQNSSYGSCNDLLKTALERSKIACIVADYSNDMEETERTIVKEQVTCLIGTTSRILSFCRKKGNIFSQYIKKVIVYSNCFPDVLVTELFNNYGCKVYQHYGRAEMGFGGGIECESQSGYHLRENQIFFEIIHPVTLEPLKEGFGEVVFTSFRREAMPLIRYRTGDIARFITDTCSCGTFLKRMLRVTEEVDNE